jgi:hypothetical protein
MPRFCLTGYHFYNQYNVYACSIKCFADKIEFNSLDTKFGQFFKKLRLDSVRLKIIVTNRGL